MSLSIFHLMGWKDTLPAGKDSQIVSVPLTVRFAAQSCRWKLEGSNLRHVPQRKGVPIPIENELSAWDVRSDFLRARTVPEVLAFLQKTGIFSRKTEARHWNMGDVSEFQAIVRYLIQTEPAKWRARAIKSVFKTNKVLNEVLNFKSFPVEFAWTAASHSAVIIATSTLQAILATVHIDHLRQARFGFCKRADCGRQFEVASKHKRLYCSPECAHLMTVRRYRQKQSHA